MKNTFKKLTLCVLALTAVIMSSAAVKSISGTGENNAPEHNVSLAAADKTSYCLRDWHGYIAVFEGDGETPATVTDIPTETLNKVDREKLKGGIEAATREELLSLLEDFSS